ncbi:MULTISPECIES: biopolymer transporter ExbD [unclassified Ruegeria]|uniref:ExbD/TolR family protein n=1 Tax=unclassified Ruegeria TaxID=2625375 RepID=UPI001ADBE796|nr:biopolymer transporter ExbD [Ruegeria sp. R8_1]MBO9417329.1 biopolymer transporter ExbD [Ruegeria sp. R8_2]
MKITRPAPRHHPETIIALIDVVFFLLVFFMLIGRMDATAPFDVAPPVAVTGADMPAGGITISVAADGTIALDGETVAPEDIERRVQSLLVAQPDILIRINAHREATLRSILPRIAQFEAMGARDVVLVVTPPGPAQ